MKEITEIFTDFDLDLIEMTDRELDEFAASSARAASEFETRLAEAPAPGEAPAERRQGTTLPAAA